MIIRVITNKKTTMKKIILKRLMNYKNIDKNKIKSKISILKKFKRAIVLMGKNSKKVIIKIMMTILMKRVKKMTKNFINITSLTKKSQTSVIWTKIIRKKLLKSNSNKNTLVLIMVFQPSEVQKSNSRGLLMFLRNKLSHLLIPLRLPVQSKMLLHLLSIEKLLVTLEFKTIGYQIALKIQRILSSMLWQKIIKVVSSLCLRLILIMIKLKQSLIMFL